MAIPDTNPDQLVGALQEFVSAAVAKAQGDTSPVKPSHRVPFHWPPHPVSKDYHVLPSDWTGRASIEMHGERFDVDIARTAQGVFGRIDRVWNEAKGESVEEVLSALQLGAEPFFRRQWSISETLGLSARHSGAIRDLEPAQLVKLLYCPDRDVAHEAQLAIESRASTGIYGEALLFVLHDRSHPHRRSAEWCVLDMFEDLPSFFPDEQGQARSVEAIKALVWDAEDDFARTIYKAGVVLGGHICTEPAARALLACVRAPSPYGRRSAIHALFHLAEWMPELKPEIMEALDSAAVNDTEPKLREFAASMARDVRAGAFEHMTEPVLEGEG